MEKLLIQGGTPLKGEIEAAGAKNAVTKVLVASLLSDKKCLIKNVPNIGDVQVTVNLCKEIGMDVKWDKEKKTLEIQTKELKTSYIPQHFSGSNRIPILMIGALLGRTSEDIIVPTSGGCLIGKRSVDFHIQALEKLGAKIEYREMKKEGAYFAHAHHGLTGTIIELPYPSVGATENTLLASVRAKGTTVIKNAAVEPEIINLILFLQKLGARIAFDSDRTIIIEGTQKFYEVEHTILPDRLEIASYGMAAIATKGNIFIKGARQADLLTFLNKLRGIGGEFKVHDDGIEFFYKQNLEGNLHIETNVHPGFATDWQQPFAVLLTQTRGMSVIHETVYEKRFGYTQALQSMGADIQLFKHCLGGKSCRYHNQDFHHSLVIKGPTPLKATSISIPDLRAGFAYVLAALVSEGSSTLTGLHYLDRGYEHLTDKLNALGANIKRENIQLVKKAPTPNNTLEFSKPPVKL
ncbi:UDP-N-acetylglucosamine 1-carboxyvinyltransferase [Chlamydiales bacterium SCGC AB-751-O23]|jgi:UDP-N-acetylglucosamine 1-carboxyvinyltransferase|nr:UDP-N-acetylglucosamine 1-carboxyvinyltransferase [Chlamydiales bacterium SCGC AB-751-O23]